MYDNQLVQLIITVLQAGFVANGFTTDNGNAVAIKQSYQPTTQGVNTQNTIYLFKIGDHRYGWTGKTDVWDQDTETEVHTERQWYETMFQLSALALQNAADVNSKTASDLLNIAAAIMQSDATLAALHAQGVGILRVTDVRNPYFTDDKDRYEAAPSFDFTLEHEQVIISSSPVIEDVEFNIQRI